MNEFDFIESCLAPLASNYPTAFALTDDAAALPTTVGKQWIVSKDLMVEGIHFPAKMRPDVIAQRLLRVNLSDMAAMGAIPKAYVLGLSLKSPLDEEWVRLFCEGLRRDQDEFAISLIGGDTVRAKGAMGLSITVFGEVDEGRFVRRSGAQIGDDIYVSGTIGDAALGLKCVLGELTADAYLVERFERPTPRVSLGSGLVDEVSSMMDISDGLVGDIAHILKASKVGGLIDLSAVPLSTSAERAIETQPALAETLYCGGDDYELLFTASHEKRGKIADIARMVGVDCTRIGSVSDQGGLRLIDKNGDNVTLRGDGYKHF